MKNLLYSLIAMFSVFTIQNTYSQWSSDILLSANTGYSHTSYNGAWSIAATGNIVHTVWIGTPNYRQVCYRRSIDGGVNWDSTIMLTNDTWYNTDLSAIAASDSNVFVMCMYNHNAGNDLKYRHSTNAGQTWGTYNGVSLNVQTYQCSVASNGTDIHVIFPEPNSINYIHSAAGNLIMGTDIQLVQGTGGIDLPSVALSGNELGFVWQDNRDGNSEIYFKRSTNDGAVWQPDLRLTNNVSSSLNPCIAINSSNIHVVWNDNRDGNYQIYYKRSTDAGLTWGTDIRLTNTSDTSYLPSIAVSGNNVHVVWEDHRDGNWEIYYKESINAGISWGTDLRLTNDDATSQFPSVAVSGSAVHVIWTDFRNQIEAVYYKRNPTGNVLGINPVSSQIPNSFALYQNYPNPFNPTTKIKFDIPSDVKRQTSNVKLVIYDAIGREVSTLVNEELRAGSYEVEWNASNYPSGVYFYKLISGSFGQTKKLVLIK